MISAWFKDVLLLLAMNLQKNILETMADAERDYDTLNSYTTWAIQDALNGQPYDVKEILREYDRGYITPSSVRMLYPEIPKGAEYYIKPKSGVPFNLPILSKIIYRAATDTPYSVFTEDGFSVRSRYAEALQNLGANRINHFSIYEESFEGTLVIDNHRYEFDSGMPVYNLSAGCYDNFYAPTLWIGYSYEPSSGLIEHTGDNPSEYPLAGAESSPKSYMEKIAELIKYYNAP